MSQAIIDALSAFGAEHSAADYAKTGFHHTWALSDLDAIVEVALAFRERAYVLEMITCQDRRQDLECMRLVYGFNSWEVTDRHVVYLDLEGGVHGRSITSVYRTADWHERETWDMYGVRFDGHPNLKRLLLPEDADFHALLKDFGRMEDAEVGG